MQRRMYAPYLSLFALVVIVILVLPALLVLPFKEKESIAQEGETVTSSPPEMNLDSSVSIPVFRMGENQVETIGLEEYVKGVVASEMPADFELEALKAQALSARTFIINHLLNPTDIDIPEPAIVTDSIQHQVYMSDTELQKLWGSDYQWKMEKITQAVYETKGEIIVYEEQPIAAQFFSTSNGYTENSEDYWRSAFPYLKSVESPWDEDSPKFYHTEEKSVNEVQQLLGVQLAEAGPIGEVLERTAGKRIGKIKIGDKTFTGRDVRELLNLRSSDFEMERIDDKVIIRSEGFGHGVGMSQFGANGMAKEGKTYGEIIKYYYTGVSISNLEPYTAKLSAYIPDN